MYGVDINEKLVFTFEEIVREGRKLFKGKMSGKYVKGGCAFNSTLEIEKYYFQCLRDNENPFKMNI